MHKIPVFLTFILIFGASLAAQDPGRSASGPATSPALPPADTVPAVLYSVTEVVYEAPDPGSHVMTPWPRARTTLELYVPSAGLTVLQNGQVVRPPLRRYAGARDSRSGQTGQTREAGVWLLGEFALTNVEVEILQKSLQMQEDLSALISRLAANRIPGTTAPAATHPVPR